MIHSDTVGIGPVPGGNTRALRAVANCQTKAFRSGGPRA